MVFETTVGKSDLVIGQEYFGSIVRKVKQEVEEKDGKYKRVLHYEFEIDVHVLDSLMKQWFRAQ